MSESSSNNSQSSLNSVKSVKLLDVLNDEEKINDILYNIELFEPKSVFYSYLKARYKEKYGKQNKHLNNIDSSTVREFADEYKKLSNEELNKYKKAYENDISKYLRDIEIVKTYIFKGYNGFVKINPTAYRLFLNEHLIKGLDMNQRPEFVRKEARKIWKNMPFEEKNYYVNAKTVNDLLFNKLSQFKNINPLLIFVQTIIDNSKKNNTKIPKIEEIAKQWDDLNEYEKLKYEAYAKDIKKERFILNDLYELVYGIKPKKPAGAFKIFIQELIIEGKISSFKEGEEAWNKLNQEEKEFYLKLNHRLVLAYKYKNLIGQKKIKGIIPKKPHTPLQHFINEKKGHKPPNGELFLSYWSKIYKGLSQSQKEKYIAKYVKERHEYEKKIDDIKDFVFDIPKNPRSYFLLYLEDKITENKANYNSLSKNEILEYLVKDFKENEKDYQKKYEKKYNQEIKIYLKRMLQFEKCGYYNKSYIENLEYEDLEENKGKKSTKKRKSNNENEILKERRGKFNGEKNPYYKDLKPYKVFKGKSFKFWK